MGIINILELLEKRGFDKTRPARFVRHTYDEKGKGYDINDLIRDNWFDDYQSYQNKRVFDGIEQIISFVGTEGTKARFSGVYKILGKKDAKDKPLSSECPFADRLTKDHCYYEMQKDNRYNDLENRVVVEWGKDTRNWIKNLSSNSLEVVEVFQNAITRPIFKDYLDFTLTYSELVELTRNESTNNEWRNRLSAVGGIYLILAKTIGKQYVGSASGQGGIWQRWASYAKTKHGDDILLKELINNDSSYPQNFLFSVLQIMPISSTREELHKLERHYKEKLGSAAMGLNGN